MVATLILWGHALAALMFGAVGTWALRSEKISLPRLPMGAALLLTALWALAVAGIGEDDAVTQIAASARNLCWLGVVYSLYRNSTIERAPASLGTVFGVIGMVIGATIVLDIIASASPPAVNAVHEVAVTFKLMTTIAALLLVQRLHNGLAPRKSHAARPVALALGSLWLVDANVLSVAWLVDSWPMQLIAVRGMALVLIAAVIAAGIHRPSEAPMQMSRTVIYQALTMVAVLVYVALLTAATNTLGAIGGPNARLLQTAFVFGSTAAILTLISSSWLRAWLKVKLAKHFFRHRYDYRAEWMRFTETLGEHQGSTSLEERIIKSLADLTDSPAGVLLSPQGQGRSFGPNTVPHPSANGLTISAAWSIDRNALPNGYGECWSVDKLDPTMILELDRFEGANAAPPSIRHWDQAWVVVPLPHQNQVVGAIILARPPVPRALDWEDFDLLRAAGRQVASHIAEARAQEALTEAERFDEFNRRFAFILHDIKNLVSQLTLTARNAQRHADNPEFRADMIATLQDSAGRMNDLLARLSQHHRARNDPPVPMEIGPVIKRVAERRRGNHRVEVDYKGSPIAIADAARLETLLGHLVQNAIEASPVDKPVTLAVSSIGDSIAIDVIDHGCGMSPAFIRDKLFRPFVSSKANGFGIGAFEARKLVEEMGGKLDVSSVEGYGSRFRVLLRVPQTTAAKLGNAA